MIIAELCVRQVNGARELVVVDLEQTVDALKSTLAANRQWAWPGEGGSDPKSLK